MVTHACRIWPWMGSKIIVALSVFAPRKQLSFAERKTPLIDRPILYGIFLLAISIPCFSATGSGQAWPTFRNDFARSGYTHYPVDATRLKLAWQWNSGRPPQPAWDGPARWDAYQEIRNLPAMRQYDDSFHPVSDEKTIFFGSSSEDTLFALDLATGVQRWSFVAGGPIRLAPTISTGLVYFGCDDGYAYCLQQDSGELVWKFSPSAYLGKEQRRVINNDRLISFYPVRTGVAIRDGVAYFGAGLLPWRESCLCAVDAATGQLVAGEKHFVEQHQEVTLEGPLLIAANRLIAPQGRVAPLLFDRTTGENLGSLSGGGGITIVLAESGEIVRAEGGGPARAGQIGVFKGKERIATFPKGRAIVVRPDTFYVINQTQLLAAGRKNNELKWQLALDEPQEIIMAAKTLFVGGRDYVSAIDSDSGKIVWKSRVQGRASGLIYAENTLIVSTDNGKLYAFSQTANQPWREKSPVAVEPVASPEVPAVEDQNLIHRWVFHRSAMRDQDQNPVASVHVGDHIVVRDQSGFAHGIQTGQAEISGVGTSGQIEAVELQDSHFALPAEAADRLPTEAISAEAWVRVDQPMTWGGIVGHIQDDGSTEHGWLLGFRDDKFSMAVAGKGGGLTYLTSTSSFHRGQWYHVAGTFDGHTIRLYVNGTLTGQSEAETGPISYSAKCYFTLGAYRDQNERYPFVGAIHEIRIYDAALTAERIRDLFNAKSKDFPSAQDHNANDSLFSWGPIARFVRPGEVEISYGTKAPTATVVDLIIDDEIRKLDDPQATTEHRILARQLPWRRQLEFQIRDRRATVASVSPRFVLDTHFDWTAPDAKQKFAWTKTLVDGLANPRGMALILGRNMADKARELAQSTQLTVVLLEEDTESAATLRRQWQQDPTISYGQQLSVLNVAANDLPSAFAAVVLSDRDNNSVRRLVRPEGGILYDGEKVVWRRPGIQGAGQWGHMYGNVDNSAFAGETLSGAKTRADLVTQWIGRPGPRYQSDREHRKSAPLAIGGRLYLQGLQRLIALDAYSGSVLWNAETPTIMRWNVHHDCANWCADDQGVYLASDDRAWFVDGKSGNITRQFEIPQTQGETKTPLSWGYIARHQEQLLGTVVSTSAIYKEWWGKQFWFDTTNGADTHVVTGDLLFAMDYRTGKLAWDYAGLVLHPTITVMNGHVYFVEDRTDDHLHAPLRRVSIDANQSHFVVGLDVVTGAKRWEKELPSFAGHVSSLYLAGGGDQHEPQLFLVGSEASQQKFLVRQIDPADGTFGWTRTVAWEANHHGKHISRPAIQGDVMYLRPEVIDLNTGKTLKRGFPGGHGCSSYALCTNGIFTRLGTITWWDARSDTVNRFARVRTDCWISTIPAQGMVLSPEAGGGCSCGSWLESSFGMLPRALDDARLLEEPDEEN